MISRLQPYRVKVYGRPTGKVVFFFCPFGIRRWQFRLPFAPIGRLRRSGYQVVCYDFSLRVPWVRAAVLVGMLQAIHADVAQRVEQAQHEGIVDFSVFGVSMGTVFAAYSGAHLPQISHLVLNLCYADVPRHIIEFPRMLLIPNRAARRMVVHAGGEAGLRQLLDDYSPLTYASEFRDKHVLLYLARKDTIMPFANTSQLLKALKQGKADWHYVENVRFDHFGSALVNNIRAKVYLNFLEAGRRK